MKQIRNIFTPLTNINSRISMLLIAVNVVLALFVWQTYSTGGLIPTPFKVSESLVKTITSASFVDNLFSSLVLTIKGMFISIVMALIICYLSLIPLFSPLAKFIMKCRYLTLTGLIFLFTLLTDNGHSLKMSLLVFGIVPFFVTSFLSIIGDIKEEEYNLCKTLRMNNWESLLEVVIIGKLDQVIEVIRQNFAIAWMMITMVEGLCMSEGGLGTMLIKSNKYIDLGSVFSVLLIILVIGILFDLLLKKVREMFFPYTKIQLKK